MNSCVIFCAAEFDSLAEPLQQGDFLLAADGGLVHLQALGLEPDGILGDFDSLGYVPRGAKVFPVEKDDTDAMLAARQGLKLGYARFILYGSVDGPRLDHTVANFQTLQFLADRGAQGYLVGKDYIITVIRNETIGFSPACQGILSVFCLTGQARGVTIRDLQYPLDNGTLSSGFPLGVSNHFTGRGGTVSVADGSLLIMWDRRNGFPITRQQGGVTA